MSQSMNSLQGRYNALQYQYKEVCQKLHDRKTFIRNILSEISKVYNMPIGYKDSRVSREKKLHDVLTKYSRFEHEEDPGLSDQIEGELGWQKMQVERQRQSLERKVEVAEAEQKEEAINRQHELVELLNQNAELRRTVKQLREDANKQKADALYYFNESKRESPEPGASRRVSAAQRQESPTQAPAQQKSRRRKGGGGNAESHRGWLYTTSSSRAITEMVNKEREKQQELQGQVEASNRRVDQLQGEVERLQRALAERDQQLDELRAPSATTVTKQRDDSATASSLHHSSQITSSANQTQQFRPATAPTRQTSALRPSSASSRQSSRTQPQASRRPVSASNRLP